jgi:hypothetical protein
LAEEIEDVGKSEQRELASRMAVLLAHLLKWQFQPERRASWQTTIRVQRNALIAHLQSAPSLKTALQDPAWWARVWADAVSKAIDETGLSAFPDECPWGIDRILNSDWKPE